MRAQWQAAGGEKGFRLREPLEWPGEGRVPRMGSGRGTCQRKTGTDWVCVRVSIHSLPGPFKGSVLDARDKESRRAAARAAGKPTARERGLGFIHTGWGASHQVSEDLWALG